jgi:hypothetical protein
MRLALEAGMEDLITELGFNTTFGKSNKTDGIPKAYQVKLELLQNNNVQLDFHCLP